MKVGGWRKTPRTSANNDYVAMNSYEVDDGMSRRKLATPRQEVGKIEVEMCWVLNVLKNKRMWSCRLEMGGNMLNEVVWTPMSESGSLLLRECAS